MAIITPNVGLLGFRRYVQNGSITASSQQSGYEAPYLGDPSIWEYPWRSANGALSAVDINFDLGAPYDINALALACTNLSLTAQVRGWASLSDPTFSSVAWDTGQINAFDTSLPSLRPTWVQPWGRHVALLRTAGTVSARYGRIRIWDPANPYGFLRASVGLMEDLWQPKLNANIDWQENDQLWGSEPVQQLLRGFTANLWRLSQAEKNQIQSLVREWKTVGRVLFFPRPLQPAEWLARLLWAQFSDGSSGDSGSGGSTTIATYKGVDVRGRFNSYALNVLEVDQ